MTDFLYNQVKLARHTQARADDVNREFSKVQAALEELRAAFLALQNPNPEPVQLYTWMAWANSSDGTQDFTTEAAGDRSWIGFAFNRLVETPSQNPSDYRWSLLSGALGNFVALDTTNVGGRNALQLVGDLDTLATQLLAYQYDRQTLRDYVDARLYVDGQPVNTVIVSEKNERQTETTALAETISLIGAKTPDGGAFILDLNKTYVSPTTSLSTRLSTIQTEVDQAKASAQSVQQALISGNFATASDLSLIGAKTLDGSAFVMNLATVKVDGATTLGQYINSAVASAAGGAASVTQIYDAVIGPNGASAKAVLRLDVNGHVIGYEATNDGDIGTVTFTIDKFQLLDTEGASLFTAADGVVKMPNVEVGRLKAGIVDTDELVVNAAAQPMVVSAGATVLGAGYGVRLEVLTANVTLKRAAMIYAHASLAQGFPSGNRQWRETLAIGGTDVFAASGSNAMDSISLSGALYLPAGTYPVKVFFEGADATVRVAGRTLFVMVIY